MRPQITALFDIFKCKSTIFSQLRYRPIKAKHTDCNIFWLTYYFERFRSASDWL